MSETVTIKLLSGDEITFAEPPAPTKLWWWGPLDGGVFAVVLRHDNPRRVRHIPATSIDWWEWASDAA